MTMCTRKKIYGFENQVIWRLILKGLQQRAKNPGGGCIKVLDEAVHIQASNNDPKTVSLNSQKKYFAPQYVCPAFH